MKNLALIILLLPLVSACNSGQQTTPDNDQKSEVTETQYQYQRAFTTLEWTAYKTTAKVGVKGSFDEFNITPGVETGSPTQLMNQLSFSIPTGTTNSGNEERDPKIITSFFGTMMNTENITGSFTSVNGNDSAGTVRISLTMNDATHEVDGNYVVEGNEVKIHTDINLGDWKAESSVAELNKVCTDLHKGEDGVSKLWPDVAIDIVSKLKPVTPAS